MNIALIPPFAHLSVVKLFTTHLALANVCRQAGSNNYTLFYRKLNKQRHYVILDNGAHEDDAPLGIDVLLWYARVIGAQEIVMPDVQRDYHATREATQYALRYLNSTKGQIQYIEAGSPALMYVPQGRNESEWRSCLDSMLLMHHDVFPRRACAIGLSKIHQASIGLTRLCWLLGQVSDPEKYPVHILGWPNALELLAMNYPWLRSVDSAKPFAFAAAGYRAPLDPDLINTALTEWSRPPNYFNLDLSDQDPSLLSHNINVFHTFATYSRG